jgi:hypothetical protein
MSTIAYAAMTQKREDALPGTRDSARAPATGPYLDVLLALVPAEVLALHAYLLGLVTTDGGRAEATKISDPDALKYFFWGLVGASVILYVAKHVGSWDRWDWLRMIIPPLAFIGWTMAQPTSAFDAVGDEWTGAARYGVAAFAAIMLAAVAAALASKADKQIPDASPGDRAEEESGRLRGLATPRGPVTTTAAPSQLSSDLGWQDDADSRRMAAAD